MKCEYIDHMGTDLSVVNAAKVSFDKKSEWGTSWKHVEHNGVYHGTVLDKSLKPEDTKLIHYLARGMSSKDHEKIVQEALEAETREVLLDCFARLNVDTHWTPFAHTAISLRMSAPVPIRTQCFKHKQGLVENEESRRYISSTPTLFVPKEFRSAPTGGAKQGSSGVHHQDFEWTVIYKKRCQEMIELYEAMVTDGVCPEQARFVLPQGCEVQWIWTGNLFAFANFYNKRTDAHAQKEIQELARMVGGIIEPLFPVSWKALTE